MNDRRHPSFRLLTGYATGDPQAPPAITLSAHLETCEACRETVSQIEDREGHGIETSAPASMSSRALEDILARIDEAPTPAMPAPALAPRARREFLGDVKIPQAVAAAGLGSRRWLAPGIWAAPVGGLSDAPWRTVLLRVARSAHIPSHGHSGQELIAVLQGSFHDGGRYVAGDFAENDAGLRHHLTVSRDGPCACLISTRGPIEWRGWSRIVGAMLGI